MCKRKITGATARVSQANTSKTVAMSKVLHCVTLTLSDNSEHTMRMLASDPQNAIDLAWKGFQG